MNIPEMIAELRKRQDILINTQNHIASKINDLTGEKDDIENDVATISDAIMSLEQLTVEVNSDNLKTT